MFVYDHKNQPFKVKIIGIMRTLYLNFMTNRNN